MRSFFNISNQVTCELNIACPSVFQTFRPRESLSSIVFDPLLQSYRGRATMNDGEIFRVWKMKQGKGGTEV